MEEELVSVIMGVYNCADTIDDAIQSILNQSYTNWEFIICDDGSSDGTYEHLLKFKKMQPEKFIILKNETNQQLAYTLNKCLKYVNGTYVARMDGDDKSFSARFKKQVSFLKENKEIDLVGSSMQRFNKKGIHDILPAVLNPDKMVLKKTTPFHHATIMTYPHVYDELGGYTVLLRTIRCEDYDLWFKFFKHDFKGHNIMEPLYYVRENLEAIQRRTVKCRWNLLKTIIHGYQTLDFPFHWYVIPISEFIIKSIIPSRLFLEYRKMQLKKFNKLQKK